MGREQDNGGVRPNVATSEAIPSEGVISFATLLFVIPR
jgi:hypothetical protein